MMLANAAHEAGTFRAARAEMEAALRHQKEWRPSGVFYGDQSLGMTALLRSEKLATGEDVEQARKAYRSRFATIFDSNPTLALGAVACQGVETEDEALLAVAHLPAAPNTGELMQQFESGRALIGIALHKAGDSQRAIPWLRDAAGSCRGWMWPRAFVDAHRHLGEALESTGDKDGACEAYGFVLRHWGRAKPRSITAELVRKRATALGCPSPRDPAR